jgi:hypothetical protein
MRKVYTEVGFHFLESSSSAPRFLDARGRTPVKRACKSMGDRALPTALRPKTSAKLSAVYKMNCAGIDIASGVLLPLSLTT